MPTLWTKSHSGIETPVCGLHGAVIEDLAVDGKEDDDFLRDSVVGLGEHHPTLHSVPQLDVWAWAQRLLHCNESTPSFIIIREKKLIHIFMKCTFGSSLQPQKLKE
jgi:hypothetical protein